MINGQCHVGKGTAAFITAGPGSHPHARSTSVEQGLAARLELSSIKQPRLHTDVRLRPTID